MRGAEDHRREGREGHRRKHHPTWRSIAVQVELAACAFRMQGAGSMLSGVGCRGVLPPLADTTGVRDGCGSAALVISNWRVMSGKHSIGPPTEHDVITCSRFQLHARKVDTRLLGKGNSS